MQESKKVVYIVVLYNVICHNKVQKDQDILALDLILKQILYIACSLNIC